jgi:hypothetical protein
VQGELAAVVERDTSVLRRDNTFAFDDLAVGYDALKTNCHCIAETARGYGVLEVLSLPNTIRTTV